MVRNIVLIMALTLCQMLSAADVTIKVPFCLMGRDYAIASRVVSVDRPVSVGRMKIHEGLRVYNPQIVRMAVSGDSLIVAADDAKRGPQRVALPVVSSADDGVTVAMKSLFTTLLRGVDILSDKQHTSRLDVGCTNIETVSGTAEHLEVNVSFTYKTDSLPLTVKVRKSLMLLEQTPMHGRPLSRLIGYKSSNNKYIDRFDISRHNNIVFYVSDAFPKLWQKAIRQGVEDWNIAFGRIGKPHTMKALLFSEAGRDFDPYSMTNNCIFMSDIDFENAQGNHWTDPRSGEILQADVLLYKGVVNRLKTWMLMQTGAYNKDVADGQVPDSLMERMLRYAVAHEIGHCLGLEHNYRASFAYETDSLRSEHFCSENGTTASIMDYARFNYIAQPGDGVKSVFPPVLGPYDIYAIEAGYGDWTDDVAYMQFIKEHQTNPVYLYKKRVVTSLPNDVEVQPDDLGNNPVAAAKYAIANIKALPVSVLKALNADDVQKFYFAQLMHIVPCIDKDANAKSFVENQLNDGYRILYSDKMQQVYGQQREAVEQKRGEFVQKVSHEHALNIVADPLSAGQWMPHQMIDDDIFALLKKDGVKLSKKDIYNINKRCLSGAALSLSSDNGLASPFGSASFVSTDGLIITNFHCVSNYVQHLSRGDNDYMRHGCWATKRTDEAPLFNLEAHQVLMVEDVTEQVLRGTQGMTAEKRDAMADKQARALMRSADDGYGVERKVYSLMGGMQYILVRYRTFTDLRIVACPPEWLGKYGGDDDNWKWPRYSCDFAFLRAYVSPDGEPVSYDKTNVPYKTESYLKISSKPVNEGDMAMVMGFPSQTRKNIPAFALDKIVNRDVQLRARMLKAKIDFLNEWKKDATGIKLSGYDNRIGKLNNIWLRSVGEINGVRNASLVNIKRSEDLLLQEWINADSERVKRYGHNLIARMDSVYAQLTHFNHEEEAFTQLVGSGVGIVSFCGKFEKLLVIDKSKRKSRLEDMKDEVNSLRRNIREFFGSISMSEDREMMKRLLPIFKKEVREKYLPDAMKKPLNIDSLYAHSIMTDSLRLEKWLDNCEKNGTDEVANDELFNLCIDIFRIRVQKQFKASAPLKRLNTKLYGDYMRAKHEKGVGRKTPFDCNRTLRFSTGRVMQTNSMADMLQRNDYMPARFRQLMNADNSLPTACFITNAETASGNSGSPVLNAKGELVGLNFDRTAASAASIYRSDPLTMRNITVSIDYILWVIKNWSHSQYILNELKYK